MNQEKFVNKYIELLSTTLTEAFQKNLVSQSQKIVLEGEVDELTTSLNSSKSREEKLTSDLESVRSQLNSERLKSVNLNNEVVKLSGLYSQIENLKKDLAWKETIERQLKADVEKLKNDLDIKDEKISELNDKIKEIIENKPIVLQNNIKRKPSVAKKTTKKTTTNQVASSAIKKDAGNF